MITTTWIAISWGLCTLAFIGGIYLTFSRRG